MGYTIEKHRLVGRLVTDSKNGGHYSKSLVGWCKAPKLGCTIEKHRLVGWLGQVIFLSDAGWCNNRFISFGPTDILNYRYADLLTY